MNAALVGLAVVVVAGGVVAVSVRDPRLAALGLAVTAVLAPLVAEPIPALLPLAARVVAAVLAAYLVWLAVRVDAPTAGSAIGWPAETLVAAGAAVAAVGVATVGAGEAPAGSAGIVAAGGREILMAGFGLAVLSVAPLATGRDALRMGIGLLLAVHAAVLVRAGLAGPPSAFEELAIAALVAVVAAGAAALAGVAIRATGGLGFVAQRAPAARRVPPVVDRPAFRLPLRSAARPSVARPEESETQVVAVPDDPEPAPPAARPAVGPPLVPDAHAAGPVAPRSSGTRRIPGR